MHLTEIECRLCPGLKGDLLQICFWFLLDVSKLLPYVSFVQVKIARLAKKFGEANQATENKKKQEVRNCFSALLAPVLFEGLCSRQVILERSYPLTRCLSPQAVASAAVPKTATVPVTAQVQR